MNVLQCIGFAIIVLFAGEAAAFKQNSTILSTIHNKRVDSIISRGYNQILLMKLSPECQDKSFAILADAKSDASKISCATYVDIAYDYSLVAGAALESVGQVLTDANTIVNGIPNCWRTRSIFNIPGIVICIFGQFGKIWTAASDIWDYRRLYQEPYARYEDLQNCYAAEIKKTKQAVSHAVKLARVCQ